MTEKLRGEKQLLNQLSALVQTADGPTQGQSSAASRCCSSEVLQLRPHRAAPRFTQATLPISYDA